MRKYNKYFLTFSQGVWIRAGKRITKQAEELKLFDKVISLTNISKEFGIANLIAREKIYINENPKGYGLWFWKPYICLSVLNEIKDGDVLFYSDSGCELTQEGRFLLSSLLDFANKNGSIFFSLPLSEKFWTKRTLLDQFKKKDILIGEKTQIQATFFVLRKDDQTLKLVKSWKKFAFINKFNALKDCDFINSKIVHRNDQSILSLYVKLHRMNIYPFDLHIPSSAYFNKSICLFMPIHPVRNINIYSIINRTKVRYGILKNIYFFYFILKKHIVILLTDYNFTRKFIKKIRFYRNDKEI
jgi:hypothetical protein